MSKRDEKIEKYIVASKSLDLNLSDDFIIKVTIGLGPSIYNRNSETVSCTSSSELERIKKNFLQKKLKLSSDEKEFDVAIKKVCKTMGSSNRNKYRALFYALLAKEFKKESVYA